MKKFIKVMMILAAVFTAVGIGLSVGGVAMGATLESVEAVKILSTRWGDWTGRMWNNHNWVVTDWDDDDDEDWDDDDDWDEDYSGDSVGSRFYNVDAVSDLEIDLKYDELILKEYDGDKIRVDIKNDSARSVKVQSDSKKLKIKNDKNKRKNNRSITVSYPEKHVFNEVDIEVGAGTVEIMDRLEADKLEVSIGAGEFTNSDDIKAREASIEVGTGNVDIMQLTADKIDGECGVGDMTLELTGKESDYSYKLECGIGEISIDDDSFTALAGDKKINNSNATKYMELECGMGDISVEFSDSDE